MKKILPVLVITLYFTYLSESCSTDSFTAVQNFDGSKVLGRYFTTSRFSNNDTSICLYEDFTMVPNPQNAINEVLNRVYKNDSDYYTRCQQTSLITAADPKKNPPEGIVIVRYNTGVVQTKYISVLEDDFALVRACYEGEEYFWAYTKEQYPSNETLAKISKAQDEQGVDTSKLTAASCSKIPFDIPK